MSNSNKLMKKIVFTSLLLVALFVFSGPIMALISNSMGSEVAGQLHSLFPI